MRPKNKSGTPIACDKCGYKWLTKSKLYYVPCPRCHKLIKIRDVPTKITSSNGG